MSLSTRRRSADSSPAPEPAPAPAPPTRSGSPLALAGQRLAPDPPPAPTAFQRRAAFALLASAACVAALHGLYYFPRTVDDMFIYLRYAENAAAGHGLVYNLGERVEGFSGPLWLGALTLGEWSGLGALATAKLLGVLSLLALGAGVYRLGRQRFGLAPAVAALAVLALALDSYVVSWGLWGLETPSYLALIVWSVVWLERRVTRPTTRSGVLLAVTAGGLLLSRPEAPLMAAALVLAELFRGPDRATTLRRLRLLAGPLCLAALALGAWVIFRRVCFGLWLPHTHYAKLGAGLRLDNLAALVSQGAGPAELAVLVAAGLGAILVLWKRRDPLFLLVALATCAFVALVERDWMPNVRHFLPIRVLAPTVLLAAAALTGRRALLLLAASLTLLGALDVARVDARYGVEDFHAHGGGKHWTKQKSLATWRDTAAALSHTWPDHVLGMKPQQGGMITQLYRLFEADARPLESVWFVGRDIGRVGWLAPARIFDTDGLFTPDVVELGPDAVPDALIERAFGRPVAMSELPAAWSRAVELESVRQRYEVAGSRAHLRARHVAPPESSVVLARYEAALRKMPARYQLMTLYGEGVGAALERRTNWIRGLAEREDALRRDGVPSGLGVPLRLDGVIDLLGCELPAEVSIGEELPLTCYFRSVATTVRDYRVFVHAPGSLPHQDHVPGREGWPASTWQVGAVVVDHLRIAIPRGFSGTDLSLRIGLYEGRHRAVVVPLGGVRPSEVLDPEGRIVLPSVRVLPAK
ncbi:MAG: hypothetical protein H6744_06340 [Deltaproteobacteria bacterium]|nr:hypothetical protein [Deltaproteobacteria bacterium]MCB9786299.1 hypothetical protein [Deltaproteobacteria bacterium]